MNLVAEIATKKKDDTVAKIRSCITYIRRATIREEFLSSINEEDLKLPLDVATRWNSLLHMVEAAFKRRYQIREFLSPPARGTIKKEVLSEDEWNQMEDLIDLLKPIEQISVECSAYKTPTFHIGLAELEFLKVHLLEFSSDFTKVSSCVRYKCQFVFPDINR